MLTFTDENTYPKVSLKYECKICRFKCSHNSDWLRHLSTSKHKKTEEVVKFYECNICDYKSIRRSDYDKHLQTCKHKKTINNEVKTNSDVKGVKRFECVCGKEYNHKQSLYTHKKVCPQLYLKEETGITTHMFMELLKQKEDKSDLVLELLKQNQEFQKMLFEQNTKMMELAMNNPQTINNSNNTTTNNKFNLTFFLDNQCNDAMNLSDFLDTLHITVADTERVGAEGFIEGITKIFLNGLNQLDIYKRPIHCTDLKRETMYVRENNTWTKEEKDSPTIVNAVKEIACKNVKSIPEWKKANPESRDSSSKKSDQYLKILKESLGTCDKAKDLESYLRVATKIAKGTTIPKGICA